MIEWKMFETYERTSENVHAREGEKERQTQRDTDK